MIELSFNDECVSELQSCLDQGPIVLYQGQELRSLNEEVVGRIGGLRVTIRADEHPPPHFHVEYNGENNSFSIEDGAPLYPSNGLKQYFRNISKWHSNNRDSLIAAWNRTRPDNCPVGPIPLP